MNNICTELKLAVRDFFFFLSRFKSQQSACFYFTVSLNHCRRSETHDQEVRVFLRWVDDFSSGLTVAGFSRFCPCTHDIVTQCYVDANAEGNALCGWDGLHTHWYVLYSQTTKTCTIYAAQYAASSFLLQRWKRTSAS